MKTEKKLAQKIKRLFQQKGFKIILAIVGGFLLGYIVGFSAASTSCVNMAYEFIEKLGFTEELKDKLLIYLHSRGGF